MSLHHYRKELVSNLVLVAGKPVQFEILDGNRGCIVVDDTIDPQLVTALDQMAAKRRGGIVKITEGEYRHIKALHPFSPSAKRLQKDTLRALPPSIRPQAKPLQPRQGAFNPVAAVAGAVAAKPAAPPVAPKPTAEAQVPATPMERFRPATRRISRKEALGEST